MEPEFILTTVRIKQPLSVSSNKNGMTISREFRIKRNLNLLLSINEQQSLSRIK